MENCRGACDVRKQIYAALGEELLLDMWHVPVAVGVSGRPDSRGIQ